MRYLRKFENNSYESEIDELYNLVKDVFMDYVDEFNLELSTPNILDTDEIGIFYWIEKNFRYGGFITIVLYFSPDYSNYKWLEYLKIENRFVKKIKEDFIPRVRSLGYECEIKHKGEEHEIKIEL